MSTTLELTSHSAEETQDIGRILGSNARPGDVLLLTGPLGAGKTCLTQGIAWGLGVKERPRSPTFVLVARYKGRLTIHHADLFRIEDSAEALDLGLEEYLNDEDVCVVEWADRAPNLFPDQSLWIDLQHGQEDLQHGQEDGTRRIKLYTEDPHYIPMLRALAPKENN